MSKGASQATGLGSAEAPEPHSRLRPTDAIPCAGFTPGPWEPVFGAAHPSVAGLRWVEITPPNDFPLVRDYLSEANGRLIAAAPKMYAALAAFEKQWNACGGNSHFGGLFQNVRDAAVEALAEADAAHWTNRAKQVQP